MSRTIDLLIQAQAHAEASPMPTTLRLWRDGVAVEMWRNGRRVEKRLRWIEIETANTNAIMAKIDACASELSQ